MVDVIVILAGGQGKRLWPVSTAENPKQFMELGDGVSLLTRTVLRSRSLAPDAPVYIVAHESQQDAIVKDLGNKIAGKISIIPEPASRNTAPAIILAAQVIAAQHGTATMLVLPADQIITPVDMLQTSLEHADLLAREGYLMTVGITPRAPETGYGYIHRGQVLQPGQSEKAPATTVNGWLVSEFKEKPDVKTAQHYLDSGEYFWNSGMFVFETSTLLKECSVHAPDIMEHFSKSDIIETLGIEERKGLECGYWKGSRVPDIYSAITHLASSIDYALMEKSKVVATVSYNGFWSDAGSWDELISLFENKHIPSPVTQDVEGVFKVYDAQVGAVQSENNFIYSKSMKVALCGLRNIAVIVDNGTIMVCERGSSQYVKELCELFTKNKGS